MINKLLKSLSRMTSSSKSVAKDIVLLQFTVVNACLVGTKHKWVLVDTGLASSKDYIIRTCEKFFGNQCRPEAIILTHGHFDHVGSVMDLCHTWDIPVYAHALEFPYLTGKKDYPVPDSSVDEGLVAKMSPDFPHHAIDIGFYLNKLPQDGSIPGMPNWRWIHTPGHTEGHVSLYREKDRVLIAGDAISTTKQESMSSVITQKEKIKGPPAYLTTDWQRAEESVNKLVQLNPSYLIPSHGQPMKGEELTKHLKYLVTNFKEIAKPDQGKFVDE